MEKEEKKENKYQMPVCEYVSALTPTLFEAALSLSQSKSKKKNGRDIYRKMTGWRERALLFSDILEARSLFLWISVTPLTSEARRFTVRFWVKMNETYENLSESNRFSVNKELESNIFALNKKRKLQAQQLGLPIPKHKCWDRSFASEPVSLFDKSPEVENLFINILAGKTEGAAVDDDSVHESMKDSNSFAEASDSALSAYGEAKLQLEYAKTYLVNRPSTSSAVSDRNSPRYTDYSSGSSEDKLVCLSGSKRPSYQEFQNLEEHLLEFCNQVDNTCSEYGSNSIDQCIEKELEDIIYSNEVNPNMHVLSSGSWTVNQDAQSGTRKPTIDQEFEQYFSRLML